MNTAAPLATLPPSFDGHHWLYATTVFSLLLVVLLALEWLWRLGWCFFERPAPLKAPVTVYRIIFVALLFTVLTWVAPNLWLYMRWPALSAAERLQWAIFSNQLDAGSCVLFSIAWLAGRLGDPMLAYQLEKHPHPVHLWPTRDQIMRPIKIGVGVAAIAFALTFLR